jgi:hypothetical protein
LIAISQTNEAVLEAAASERVLWEQLLPRSRATTEEEETPIPVEVEAGALEALVVPLLQPQPVQAVLAARRQCQQRPRFSLLAVAVVVRRETREVWADRQASAATVETAQTRQQTER